MENYTGHKVLYVLYTAGQATSQEMHQHLLQHFVSFCTSQRLRFLVSTEKYADWAKWATGCRFAV